MLAETMLALVVALGADAAPPALPVPPVIRRHDRADSLYVELARGYSTLAHLNLPTPKGAGDGEGVLVAPRWVLTAAHVAREVPAGWKVTVGGVDVAAEEVVLHPGWRDGGPHDIALVRLAESVTAVAPARLYRGSDERDRIVTLVGWGDYGTGLSGPVGNDRTVRAATNRVDDATDHWITFAFDPPGAPRATDLEGVSGPGDSGGPAYLDGEPEETVAGISSGQSSRAAGGPGRYGAVEYYVRVSRYAEWIEGVIGRP